MVQYIHAPIVNSPATLRARVNEKVKTLNSEVKILVDESKAGISVSWSTSGIVFNDWLIRNDRVESPTTELYTSVGTPPTSVLWFNP